MMLIIYLYDKTKRTKKGILIACLIPVLISIAVLSWENIFSIFPIIASVIMILAFLLNSEKAIRVIGLISNILWTVYGVIYMSFSAICEVFSVIGTIIAIVKENKNKNENK